MDRIFNTLADLDGMHNHIHVWQASLRQPSDVIFQLEATLSEDERLRAGRFQFEHLRQSFIISWGVLRSILSYYVAIKPGSIQFEYTRSGKPNLSMNSGGTDIFFNLSYSNETVLFAVTRNPWIDIEHIRPISEIDEIAAHTFLIEENRQQGSIAINHKLEAFFNCWTHKEAFIKAIGEGVSFPLDQFDVLLMPDTPARLISIHGSLDEAARWSMIAWKLEEYSAALVAEGSNLSITYREWKFDEHLEIVQEPR